MSSRKSMPIHLSETMKFMLSVIESIDWNNSDTHRPSKYDSIPSRRSHQQPTESRNSIRTPRNSQAERVVGL